MIETAVARHGIALLRKMLLIRRFEEQCAQLYAEQKIRGFLHLYIGEEAVGVGVIETLGPEDVVLSTYREHGHALARGISAESIMAEMYGKQEGCSHGRGGSMHFFDARTKFYGGNAIVGGGIPVALGFALADKMRKRNAVTCCFFGEGAVAEGEFHESMNIAALWNLPVLYVCENNYYAMGTRLDLSESVTDIHQKAASYGMASAFADGMDVEAVERAAKTGAAFVRDGKGPYFLECRTYRFHGHSTADPQLYRTKAEVEEWKKRDPIPTLIARLQERGELAGDDLARLETEIAQLIRGAVDFAEAGTLEPVENLTRFVYSERKA
ncbi:MAG: pyruvate dehydrogenase (acetyl-transferring) E1 component subunit alpha [Vulcanimicrobiaceae bacterium]